MCFIDTWYFSLWGGEDMFFGFSGFEVVEGLSSYIVDGCSLLKVLEAGLALLNAPWSSEWILRLWRSAASATYYLEVICNIDSMVALILKYIIFYNTLLFTQSHALTLFWNIVTFYPRMSCLYKFWIKNSAQVNTASHFTSIAYQTSKISGGCL